MNEGRRFTLTQTDSAVAKTLEEAAALTEAEMHALLDRRQVDRQGYERLKEAMEYSVFAGGKRVRPYLCLEFCRAYGGSDEKALPYAAALEFMHTASLIHDDLPAMDNDDMRRGRPSNHKQFGEYTAILAGDALIIESFAAISGNGHCSGGQNAHAAAVLAECAGLDGMCGGQELDLYCEGREVSVWTVEKTHLLKTAAMMKASAMLGCIAAGAGEEETKQAGRFAEEVGLAFQIIDDVLDAVGDTKTLGKTAGKDAASGKNTYVSLVGLDSARLTAEALTGCAMGRAEKIDGESGKRLYALCEYLLCRDY